MANFLPDWLSKLIGGDQGDAAVTTPQSEIGRWTPKLNPDGSVGGTTTTPPTDLNPNATGLGMNVGTGQLALSGLGTLAGLFSAGQANTLANKQFDFTKNMANTNLNNQVKSYNTTLSDRLTSRGAVQGQDAATVQAEIEKNRLTR